MVPFGTATSESVGLHPCMMMILRPRDAVRAAACFIKRILQAAQGTGEIRRLNESVCVAGILACNLPKNTDTAPNPCPAPAGGK